MHGDDSKMEGLMRKLDWKWIAIGVVVMVALSLIAGIILALVLGSQIKDATSVQNITLSGGQLVLIAVINILAYAIGGFIVGVRSAGRTIIEPGISAAIAVLIALLISGNFTVVNLIAGGLIPFVAGVVGGWLGERRQGTA
jgi:hypothetical protein